MIHSPIPLNARVFGRIGRGLLGIALLAWLVPVYFRVEWAFRGTAAAAALAALVFYTAMHLLVVRFFPSVNRWLGALLAVTPVGAAFVQGGDAVQTGVGTFIAVSLLIDAVRADAGCEVMALPALLLGRRTHLVCIVFSPIDWIESPRD